MPAFDIKLKREAERLAAVISDGNPPVREEIMDRLERYPIKKGGLYLCPRCWVSFGSERPLSKVKTEPGLTCLNCNRSFDLAH